MRRPDQTHGAAVRQVSLAAMGERSVVFNLKSRTQVLVRGLSSRRLFGHAPNGSTGPPDEELAIHQPQEQSPTRPRSNLCGPNLSGSTIGAVKQIPSSTHTENPFSGFGTQKYHLLLTTLFIAPTLGGCHVACPKTSQKAGSGRALNLLALIG
jgi:hypothetical protein